MNSENAKELGKIEEKLKMIDRLENDFKENKRSLEEVRSEFDMVRKIKIREN